MPLPRPAIVDTIRGNDAPPTHRAPQRRHHRPGSATTVSVWLTLLLLMAAVPGVAPAAAASTAPTITGVACAPGAGVTLVVDFTALADEVHVRCAPGEQPSGLAALAAAGFTTTSESGAGTVCTIDGRPTEGYPHCWITGGFWSYWALPNGWDVAGPGWAFSELGLGSGPLPVDAIVALSWAEAFDTQAPRVGLADLVERRASALSAEAIAALEWIEGQLDTSGGIFEGFGGTLEIGVTLDALLALAAGGRTHTPATVAAFDQVTAELSAYTTFGEDRFAGPFTKALFTYAAAGRDVHDVDGWDLEAEVRSLVVTDGPWAGRVADQLADPGSGDLSNGFSQAYAVLGLERTDAGVPDAVVSFLLAQQCPSGGFRLFYVGDPACVTDTQVDADGTFLAIGALVGLPRTPAVAAALRDAVLWTLSRQDPGTGAFGGTAVTAAANANSTGLAGAALSAVGRSADAQAAAAWIRSLQLLDGSAGAAADDIGALGYNPGALAAALESGIGTGDVSARDQWRRATTQGVLALGLTPLAAIGSDQPLLPVTVFTDVGVGHPFADAIAWMIDNNITTGYPDGTFRPTANVTRQATAAFLWRAAGQPTPTTTPGTTFTDVGPSHPFADAIAWMIDNN
ncbi:MAG: S-layer homology domain-containing protein, partial [Acidimicrobiia bacterium]|nr:S-layer homology domain-containing protein [Acidimicrobiia bacterium]